MRRRILQLLVAVMVSALSLVAAVAPARADNAGVLLGLINTLRALHGAGPLTADPDLTRVAQAWSAHMASGYGLVHQSDVGTLIPGGWTKIGENIGEGGNLTAIYNAFVKSPFHFNNMVDPTYNLTGIAVAVGRLNTLWVTQDFEAKPGATPPTTTPPATTVTTARPPTATVPAPVATTTTTTTTVTTTTAVPPTTTTPPDTTTTVLGDSGLLPGFGSGDTTPQLPSRSPPGPSLQTQTATALRPAPRGGSLLWLVLTLSGLAVLSVAGTTTYFMKKRSHGE